MILRQLSYDSRIRKFFTFLHELSPQPDSKILLIGGTIQTSEVKNETYFFDNYPYSLQKVTILDVDFEGIKTAKAKYPEANYVLYDGKAMPFKDKSFDCIFCNAVIEHVGDFQKQKLFASEIMRVGKSWLVATPNAYFPFEFHYRLPFLNFLPDKIRRFINKFIGRKPDAKVIELLSSRKMLRLFPTSKIVKQRITFYPETLLAIGKDEDSE